MLTLQIPSIAISFALLFAVYKFILHPALLSPLANIPNAHWSSPFSELWILWVRYKKRENRTVHAAHQALGPVVRLGPKELSINDVEGLRTVYSGGFEKGEWYSIFDNYGVPCMFSSWYSRPHSARKRMISNIYSKSVVQSSLALQVQSHKILYRRLLPIISTSTSGPEGIDVLSVFHAVTMDFVTAYLFGFQFSSNFLQNEEERKHWLDLYHSRKTHTFFSQELPRFTKFFKGLGVYFVPRWVDAANAELEHWTKEKTDRTTAFLTKRDVENPADEATVFKALMSGVDKESRTKGLDSVLAQETLKFPVLSMASEMIDHLAAGHETSGITLTYLAWHLSQDLELQNRLRAELLTLSPTFNFEPGQEKHELPSSKDLDALPLLHAILMETLRLDAAIPGNQPRMTPFPSCKISGYEIPSGVRVGAQAYSLHRNEGAFPEPLKWDVGRWLDESNGYSKAQRRERERWFWAFSSGGRMCVGSNFAMHQIKLVVAALYTNFRTYIVDDEGIEQEDGYTCGPRGNKLILRFEKAEVGSE
ncbi:cytochrome P450 [Amylocarpus encephaloides]|uniref:Cytochrome P450 n=1 Tax=Amylocarpus encephaloides TaxID=45428 RepID=A0A9P7YQR0_9HELO|nr:cytochrome P450 [Amylocarpus encephaloides]